MIIKALDAYSDVKGPLSGGFGMGISSVMNVKAIPVEVFASFNVAQVGDRSLKLIDNEGDVFNDVSSHISTEMRFGFKAMFDLGTHVYGNVNTFSLGDVKDQRFEIGLQARI